MPHNLLPVPAMIAPGLRPSNDKRGITGKSSLQFFKHKILLLGNSRARPHEKGEKPNRKFRYFAFFLLVFVPFFPRWLSGTLVLGRCLAWAFLISAYSGSAARFVHSIGSLS